jgi:hypothetical protein
MLGERVAQTYAFFAFVCGSSPSGINKYVYVLMLRTAEEGKRRPPPRYPLDYLCSEAHLQEIFYLWRPHLPAPKDDMVLEAAVAGHCAAIVTHNGRHFEPAAGFGIRILSPFEFLRRLEVRP